MILIVKRTDNENDCVLTSYTRKIDLTKDEIAKRKEILDNTFTSLSLVKKNVLSKNSTLNDELLDLFLRVIRETSWFETQSVLYIEYSAEIETSQSDKSLQIIGGTCTNHWRCLFYDGSLLHVYEHVYSLLSCTNKKLVHKEEEYIIRRYPGINQSNIIF